MCSRLLQKMENFQGDLTDIFLARSTTAMAAAAAAPPPAEEEEVIFSEAGGADAIEWQFSSNNSSGDGFLHMVDYCHQQQRQQEHFDEFGNPFSNMGDPLFLNTPSSGIFTSSIPTANTSPSSETIIRSQQICNGNINNTKNNNINIFCTTNMIQISTDNVKLPVSPRPVASPLASAANGDLKNNTSTGTNHSKGSVVENGEVHQQISSPRNTGLKRRKTQAKKVVCIPAPSTANSRPSSGEMVPSDLWAWRKYGQKPIKGSPYPRGYYRCSSSKGCSARKQVERSRTDPNMLVITYTSEHNHPWPTQRNALAGSTRNQPPRTTTKTTGSTSKSPTQSPKSTANAKEEESENALDHNPSSSSSPLVSNRKSSKRPIMKEEIDYSAHDSKRIKADHHHHQHHHKVQFDEGFQQTYRPALPDYQPNHHHNEDFFADLGELEGDGRLNLLSTQGYSGDEEPENKTPDPFSFYDWVSNNIASTTTTTMTMTMTTTTTTSASPTVTALFEEDNKGYIA